MKISSWPYFDKDQINKVTYVLQSGKVNAWYGNETKSFEKEFACWVNNKYGIAIANGSLALSSAYLSLGILCAAMTRSNLSSLFSHFGIIVISWLLYYANHLFQDNLDLLYEAFLE